MFQLESAHPNDDREPGFDVLIVEDNDGDAFLTVDALGSHGGKGPFRTHRVERVAEAEALLRRRHFDAVVLDLSLPDSGPAETFSRIRSVAPQTAIVVATMPKDPTVGVNLVAAGAQDFIEKGEQLTALPRALRYAIERAGVEQKLEVARREAMVASTMKSEFVSRVSHEIRTPLNVILGLTDVLDGIELSEEARNYLSIIRRAGTTLLDLINGVLDFSKLEAGALDTVRTSFDLRKLVESTVEIGAFEAHRKGISLYLWIEEDLPRKVIGDPARLRQILVNLIGNAVKFTSEGFVRVDVRPGPENRDVVCFAVSDSGVGVPEDMRDAIFESFVQADGGVTRRFGGTGLGLSIASRLARALGGGIHLEPTEAEGSEFVLSLPLPASDEVRAPELPPGIGLRALVVDDDPTERALLSQALDRLGVQCLSASGGEEAIRTVEDAMANEAAFDLVLLDCRMPGCNGFAIAKELIRIAGTADSLVLMLTTDHRRRDLEHCRKLGMRGYLLKPAKPTILTALVGAVQAGDAETPHGGVAATRADRHLRILLAEDSPDNQLLANAYVQGSGHELVIANDGEEAVEVFKQQAFDLVLMDVQMPRKDGYSATRAIRGFESNTGRRRTPIVALTAHAFEEEIERSRDAGCNGHEAKPISKRRFFELLREFVPGETPDENLEGAMIDPDPDIADLVPGYLANRRSEVSLLVDAVGSADYDSIRVLGHNMKGTGGAYGCPGIAEIGARLEAAAKVEDAAGIEESIAQLETWLSRAQAHSSRRTGSEAQ